MRNPGLNRADYRLIISFFALFIPLFLFIFRYLDDNRLTSWRWVFGDQGLTVFWVVLVGGLILANILNLLSFYERPFFLFLASFLIASFFWGEPEVIVDASRYFTQAKSFEMYGFGYFVRQWGRDLFAWTDLPLVSFLYGVIFKYLGEQRLFVQFFTTTLFSFTTVLTYSLGKTLWDEETGFRAGFLLLGFPYLFTQVPLMLVDVPTMFFLLLSMVTMVWALSRGGAALIVFSAGSLFLAFWVKYSTWLLLSVHVLTFFYYLKGAPRQTIKRCGWVFFLFLLLVAGVVWNKHEVLVDQIAFIREYQKPGLGRWGESFFSTFLFQIHPFVTLAALYSLYAAARKKDLKYLLIGYLVILLVVLQIKRIRYLLPVFPMLALMASYGLRDIKDRAIRKYIVLCAVGFSIVVSMGAYLPFLRSMSEINIKEAGSFLDSREIATARLTTPSGQNQIVNPAISAPLLDYFTQKRIIYTTQLVSKEKLAEVKESPLRFTWEYVPPPFYQAEAYGGQKPDALVVVAATRNQSLSQDLQIKIKGYAKRVDFFKTSGVFRHQTLVTVYHN